MQKRLCRGTGRLLAVNTRWTGIVLDPQRRMRGTALANCGGVATRIARAVRTAFDMPQRDPVAGAHRARARHVHLLTSALLLATGVATAMLTGCAAWRIGESIDLARRSEPFQQHPDEPARRLLVVGDSTAVGTGASSGSNSLVGLVAGRHPDWYIENRARDGARFSDVVDQLERGGSFDMVLIQAGGNDVIRAGDLDALNRTIDRVTSAALKRAPAVILMPAGNVGNAPFFFPPISWWMTQRSRHMHRFVRHAVKRHGALYVTLFHERADDPFVQKPELNARDGLHPSDAGYAVWFEELSRQTKLF